MYWDYVIASYMITALVLAALAVASWRRLQQTRADDEGL